MDFSDIRRITITALFSDDELTERLVLKGGNALNLIYGLSSRSSVDLDFSLESDFEDLEDTGQRLFKALKNRFDSEGYVVFDEKLESKPKLDGKDEKSWWGGYQLQFKLIEKRKYELLKHRHDKLQIDAMVTGPKEKRVFIVDLSKHEYTEGKVEWELDFFRIYVYSPEMIAIEKLRALCQQMKEYPHTGKKSARARDFYDIHLVLTAIGIDLRTPGNEDLLRHIFAAKQVPLSLLGKLGEYREVHRADWPDVISSVVGSIQPFDFYFDYVLEQVKRLEPLWIE